MNPIGKKTWAIAEGYIPPDDPSKPREFLSHETVCLHVAHKAARHAREVLGKEVEAYVNK